jgi:DNA repair exonuclease SbcCD ATPase subunit
MEKGSAVREVESSLVKTQNKIVEIERRHTDAGRIRLVAESERRCVTCHQPLPPAVLDEVVAEATEVRGQTEKSLAEKRRRERALQSRLVECRRELEQVLGVEGHQRKLLVAAKAEVHEQRAALESLETQQQAAAESLQLRGRVAATQDTLHVLQKRLAERKQELGLLETQAAYPEWWVDGFQRLRADVLRRSVEFLSQRLGYYCGCLSGGTIQAEVKLDEKAISRGVGISISLRVSVLGSTYEEASGGERDRVDLAMAFALHDLAQRTSGFSANFLVCDEVGGFIDVQGVERMVSLLREKAQTLDAVFVISHNPAWKHHIDTVIRLERKDGASRVIPSKA